MENKYDLRMFVNATTQQSIIVDLVKRYKKRRKELSISQKQLASKSGVSYGSIRRFEATGDISLSSLLMIAQSMNCLEDFNELFKTPKITNLKDYKND